MADGSTGVDHDLIEDFIKYNETLINNSIKSGALSPGIIDLIKNTPEFSQGGLPNQMPVVIPQALSQKSPT